MLTRASQDLPFNNQQVVSISGTVLPEVVVKPSGLKKKNMSKLCGFSEEEKVGGEDTSKTIIYHLQKHQEMRACLGGDSRYCSFHLAKDSAVTNV